MFRFPRMYFFTAAAVCFFLSFSMITAQADPSGACPAPPSGNCGGSPADQAKCELTSGTETCTSSHEACSPACAGGCSGSFFVALGSAESQNKYESVNSEGCKGQWQICEVGGLSTYIKKYCNGDVQRYLYDIEGCQDLAEIAYQQSNLSQLGSLTSKVGQPFTIPHGGPTITITLAGLMGMMQLGGLGYTQDLILRNQDTPDGNGTYVSKYLLDFNNTILPPQLFPGSSGGQCCPTATGYNSTRQPVSYTPSPAGVGGPEGAAATAMPAGYSGPVYDFSGGAAPGEANGQPSRNIYYHASTGKWSPP